MRNEEYRGARRRWCLSGPATWLLVMLAVSLPMGGAMSRVTAEGKPVVLLADDFGGLRAGLFSSVVEAHAEYHYLPETAPKGNWVVSAFTSRVQSQRAWRVIRDGDHPAMAMMYRNPDRHTHPMLVAGSPRWGDYTLSVRFAPEDDQGQSGIMFRYRNDRCYYFFGVEGPRAVLKMVRHGTGFRQPYERVLAEAPLGWKPGAYLAAKVTVAGESIRAQLGEKLVLEARDGTYREGRIGLVADVPTRYAAVRVTASAMEKRRVEGLAAAREGEERALQAANPKPVVWKKIATEGFGAGRNLRFGDLDGDGQMDILIGQVVHHGPKDAGSELSCLTALTFDGEKLWQIGRPDPWKAHLTNDVAFQIHDLDGDGQNEVIYCMGAELVVADGRTGKTKQVVPTPLTPKGTRSPYDRFPRILGDALFCCDLRGIGRPSDLILKDRYQHVWALNSRLEVMWEAACNTGHYPCAYDVDGDGRDEVVVGYTLFDHDGKVLWSLDEQLQDHADGLAIVRLHPEHPEPRLVCAAGDQGFFIADLGGKLLVQHHVGHVQNPVIADFRPDLPGLETMTVNFWGSQGIFHFFDAQGRLYHDFEPCQHGSMCLPVNWTGKPGEFWVLSANVEEGGMFDGWGRKVVQFPADGHPDLCYAVLDLCGDCRDEVVVWDPYELWVYTQDDNPRTGRLYRPTRNPLYNYSNYQATVSLPGWEE